MNFYCISDQLNAAFVSKNIYKYYIYIYIYTHFKFNKNDKCMQQHFKTWNMYFFFRVGNVSSPQRWCLRSLRAPERWLPSTWSHWTPHTSTTEAETSSALDLQLQEHVCSPETLRIMENTSLLHAQRSQTSSTAHLVSNPSLSGSFNEYACIPGSHLAGKCPCRPCRPGKSWRLGGKKTRM